MTSLPASDPGSAAVWGSKRINSRPQFYLCLAWSGCPSNDDDDDEWNLLALGKKVTVYRRRSELFSNLFSKDEELFYCNDIFELIHTLVRNYDPNDWILFIDSSKKSIKAVLLHIGNILPSVPIAYSTTMKETFQNLNLCWKKSITLNTIDLYVQT